MKKLFSMLLTAAVLVSCLCLPVNAAGSDFKLPFELIPAKTVALSKVYDNHSTDAQFNFSMESDMIKFMQDCEDPDKKEQIFRQLGVEDMWISTQIDWAIDDKNDWHHTEYWDENDATHYFGIGNDEFGRSRLCEWDIVDLWLYPQSTNECWITRYAGNPADPEEERWNGTDYIDEENPANNAHRPGMKDVLKEGQYTIVQDEPGESHIEIDYNKHTLYARMRYYVVLRGSEKDRYLFSDWSDTAAYGKDAPKWTPPTAETLDAPEISDLFETGEEFNEYPIVGYTLTVPDKLNADLTEITARGGYISISTEARVKGNDEWKELQGDWDVKGGTLYSDILALDGEGKPLYKGTEIEFRARYFCQIRMNNNDEVIAEFNSRYSDVLTVTLENDYIPPVVVPPVDDPVDDVEPSKDVSEGSDASAVDKFITDKIKNDNDPKGSTFGTVRANASKVKNNAITVKWSKVKNAYQYFVYGNRCGKTNGAFNPYILIATTKKTSQTFKKILKEKIKKNTYYKFLVVAVSKKDKVISTSKTIHVATAGGKYTNPKSLTINSKIKKNKVSLKKGKSIALKAKAVKANKKLKVENHRKIKYESSDNKIATVSSSGKITAKKKGSCYVYAYALNGIYSQVKVTVK